MWLDTPAPCGPGSQAARSAALDALRQHKDTQKAQQAVAKAPSGVWVPKHGCGPAAMLPACTPASWHAVPERAAYLAPDLPQPYLLTLPVPSPLGAPPPHSNPLPLSPNQLVKS